MSRQSVVTPLGLITQPNEYGQYKRGALSYAKNVVMRSPGVISSMPDVRTYRANIGSGTNQVIRLLHPSPSQIMAMVEDIGTSEHSLVWVTDGGIVTPSLPGDYAADAPTAGASRFASQRQRYFYTQWQPGAVTGYKGVLVADSEGAASFRPAGLTPMSAIETVSNTTTDASVLTPPFSVAYRALVERTQEDDGYILTSAPCAGFEVYQDTGSAQDLLVTVQLPVGNNYIPGDVLKLYRTRTQTPETVTAGDTMFLAVSRVLTSTDIDTNGYVTVRDTCPDEGLGDELYSNPGQEGASAVNYDPPASSDMTLFKGHVFYAAVAAPAQAKVGPRVSFGILDTNAKRLFGIGYRTTTGDISSGSDTITNVANIRGIAVGQNLFHANFAGGFAVILAVTSTTITVSSNATGTASSASITTADVIEATIPPDVPTPITFSTPGELRIAVALFGLVGTPFVGSSNIAQRIKSDGTLVESQAGVEIIFRLPRVTSDAFELRASNGENYSPAIPDMDGGTAQEFEPQVRENRYAWSKFEQPEHVPPLNFGFCGAGTLLRMIPTRDALWMFCTDGLFRLSGDGGDGESAWRLDPADPNCFLAGRNAVGTLKETVWCYTNRGLVSISDDAGIKDVTLGVIGDLAPGQSFTDTWDVELACDQLHQEVWLTFRSGTLGAGTSATYIYSTVTKAFVGPFTNGEYSASAYVPHLSSLALADVVAGTPPGNPGVLYFEGDTANSRVTGSDVQFQPLFVEDPFNLKQFQSVGYIWETMSDAATITPSFDGVSSTAFAVNQSAQESRSTVGVPRSAAVAYALRPGFQMSDVSAPWSFRGVSAQFVDLGEDHIRG